jgi:hypothetical protein
MEILAMTQKANHTPAPWELYSPHPSEQYVDQISGDGEHRKPIFRIHHDDDITQPEAEANARLIAAAPALLGALVKSEQRINQLCDLVNTLSNKLGLGDKVRKEHYNDLANAAMAKAKGGAP